MRKIALLGEHARQDLVELLRRREIAAERLFHDHARVVRAARGSEQLDHLGEHARRDREVVERPLRGAERFTQLFEQRLGAVVTVHVTEVLAQDLEGALVDASAVLLDAFAHALAELFEARAAARHADEGEAGVAPLDHPVQGRKDLLVREVTGGAEEHEGV